ncbi:abortive infection system antitoxin AbiGi family protein [Mucilaginibacter sp.]|uniref:abortive infection system antitoxin AbiGi family protein n=1 Tax=Mucilaginibacter sp. TaxID=1882438 RepID=UPI000CB95F14|nr:abortive infection system antitoxin AbiGi family protein [Mucilaginibacter sp.]PLW91306.1 MAG: hypothetical protein C0154_01990 [Mucilaginibacter sp.]HEK21945.1 hypothetical protein [Bacteroidota bacterium]
MPLSSNSLIHLTKEKQALKGILTEDFKIKYCVEKIITQTGILTYAVPMVSFCDIPMSEIKDHVSKYGSYGIGLTKQWGQENRLNPVFYVDQHSNVGNSYHRAFNDLFIAQRKRTNELNDTEANLLDVVRYMKNYEADLERNDEIIHDYRFADEKEWRYVPTREEQSKMVIKAEVYVQNKIKANEFLREQRVRFEPKDIKYIIIQHDNEITEFIRTLRETKGKYSYDDVERLMTRIITVEQIISDF